MAKSRRSRALLEWAIGLSAVFALLVSGASRVMFVIAVVTLAALVVMLITRGR